MISIPGPIPIQIFPFFWILIAIIGWINSFTFTGTFIWAAIIFFSVLIHEFGHALTAVAFGQRARIQLVGMGGVTQREGPRLKLWKEFLIVLNGPLAGFLLFVIAYQLREILDFHDHSKHLLSYALNITIWANFFWTIINLLPIYPLDGGHLLRIILESIFGMRGIKASLLISCLLSTAIGVFFFLFQAIVAGALFLLLAFESYRAWKSSLYMTSQDQDDTLVKTLREAEQEMNQGQAESAKEKLHSIRQSTGEGMLYLTATEYLANLYYREGKFKEAYELLNPIETSLSSEALLLLHQLAYHNRDYRATVSLGDRTYQAYPNYETALINASSYALLGEADPAIGWLQRAIEDGFPDPKSLFAKKEFDSIRHNMKFQDLERKS